MQLWPQASTARIRVLASSSDIRRKLRNKAIGAKEDRPLNALTLRHQTRKEIVQRGLRVVAQAAVHR